MPLSPASADHRPRVLAVDDEPTNLQVLRQVLGADYRLLFATDGTRALQIARQQQPELILLDVMMPGMDGYTVCRTLKADAATRAIPVVFVTALNDVADEAHGFDVGCVDYIAKPFSAAVVRARVKTHLSLVRMDELTATRLQIVQRLGRAAEYKDNETGMHVIRMSHFAHRLALAAGCGAEWADDLLNAAPMHDVGKIGIPDAMLQKPGKLTVEEFEVMKTHTTLGRNAIEDAERRLGMRVAFLSVSKEIAYSHQEKWDGSGYPEGLAGDQIPVSARLMAVADVYDALINKRVYKAAFSHDQACSTIVKGKGTHFDPDMVDAFVGIAEDFRSIALKYPDPE